MRALPALLIVLSGCVAPPADEDGDGFTRPGGDCDDTDAAVYPGAEEVCNGTDDDCDGAIDQDAVDAARAYADADGDGFGDLLATARLCTDTPGHVDNPDDCDDTDAAIRPGADEVCDGIDNDCDSSIDEDARDPSQWHADADGDGYGAPDSVVAACAQPSGAVADGTDCDDTNVLIHPGADEVWYDGIDQDCAGGNDFDADADGYDADSHGGGDCDDAEADVHPDAEEICSDGQDNDCDQTANGCGISGALRTDDADQVWAGASSYARTGHALALMADMDHDGIPELAVGAPYGAGYSGAVYIVPADSSGQIDDAAIAELRGATYSYAGTDIDSADLDGDGYDDLIVGATGYRDGSRVAGAAFVAHGPLSGSLSLDGDAARFLGTSTSTGVTVSAVGDIDGDGDPEVAVAAPYDAAGGAYYTGAARLLLSGGALDADGGDLADSDITIAGEAQLSYFGYTVEGLGDVDGDGVGDLGVGGYLSQAAVFTGLSSGSYVVSDAAATYTASSPVLAELGDLDRDGYDDFAVASSSYTSSTLSIYYGGAGSLTAAQAQLTGPARLSAAGFVGDVSGDGTDTLLVGYADAAYLIPADCTGTSSVSDVAIASIAGSTGDGTGAAVAGMGDVDGDGFSDLATSAHSADSYTGEVYLFYGGGL